MFVNRAATSDHKILRHTDVSGPFTYGDLEGWRQRRMIAFTLLSKNTGAIHRAEFQQRKGHPPGASQSLHG